MYSLVVLSLLALGNAEPQTCVLRPGTSVWDVTVQDLNNDGKADILTVCCDEDSYPLKKYVAVFLADETGVYSAKPSLTVDLAPETGAVFLAECDGSPPVELVAADSGGAYVYRFDGAAFATVAEPRFTSLLPSGSKEPLFLRNAAEDLDGDGVDEWLVPVGSGYAIRNLKGLVCDIRCDVVSEIRDGGAIRISHQLPAFHVFELEGQEQKGLVFLSDEFADFAYGPDWSERKRFKIPLELEKKWEASAQMADINGNGLPDLIITQTKGTINLMVLTQVYLASAAFTYPDTPSATFEAQGAVASPLLKDVNSDGKQDILFVKIPFGLKAFISYFIMKKLTIQVDAYIFKDGFDPKPDFHQSISLDAPEGREQVAYTMGDFSGDGRIDVAFGGGKDNLVIHNGANRRFISSRPWAVVEVPTFGVARTYDLNGNEGKDIIIFHPGTDNKDRVEVVLF